MDKCVDCGDVEAGGYLSSEEHKDDGPLCRCCWEKRYQKTQERLGACLLCGSIPAKHILETGNRYNLKPERYLKEIDHNTNDISVKFSAKSDIARFIRRKANKDRCSVTAVVRDIIWEYMESEHEQG